MLRFIAARDHGLMRRIHGWQAPRWFRIWMLAATRGGDGWLWIPVCVAALVAGGRNSVAAVAAAGSATAAGAASFLVLKRFTNRRRPCDIQPHCWSEMLPPDQFSFPSGHTITSFATATSLALFYEAWAAPLLVCAASVALSRVVLGMHFLSDVAAGAILGAALGAAAWVVFR